MEKWGWIISAGAGIALASVVGYQIYSSIQEETKEAEPSKQSKADMEEMLDDDFLSEEYEEKSVSAANSDYETESEAETKDEFDLRLQRRKTRSVGEGTELANLALKSKFVEESKIKATHKWIIKKKKSKMQMSPRTGKDMLFYNLFACYAKTAYKSN